MLQVDRQRGPLGLDVRGREKRFQVTDRDANRTPPEPESMMAQLATLTELIDKCPTASKSLGDFDDG